MLCNKLWLCVPAVFIKKQMFFAKLLKLNEQFFKGFAVNFSLVNTRIYSLSLFHKLHIFIRRRNNFE